MWEGLVWPKLLVGIGPDIAAITDRAGQTSWLQEQPNDVQVAIAARGGLRTVPGLGSTSPDRFGDIALACLRTAITASVAVFGPSEKLRLIANALGGLTTRIAENATLSEYVTALSVSAAAFATLPTGTEILAIGKRPTRWAVRTGPPAGSATQAVSVATNDATLSIQSLMFGNAAYDALMIESGHDARYLMSLPLWIGINVPEEFSTQFKLLNMHFSQVLGIWSFWRDWYQGFLDGEPLDWELQRRVALIPDEDWDEGPAHVSGVIDEIRARIEVERHAEAVAALLAASDLLPAGIGHNNPPDAVDDLPISLEDLAETNKMIARVLREVGNPKPDKSVVEGAATWIRQALWTAALWFAMKADIAAGEFAKKFGGYCAAAALPAIAWSVGQMPRLLDALSDLAKSMETWLTFLH